MEIAEITPWLLSGEEALQVSPSSGNISVASRMYNELMIIAVNKGMPLKATSESANSG